jgi:pimeloyl-ACP methyl ester carboxylesterase
MNIAHPWQTPRTLLPHLWRFLAYQPALAAFGVPLMRRTPFVQTLIKSGLTDKSAMSDEDVHWFGDRFRDPVVARTARDTYRTFWLQEVRARARNPETRRSVVPTRVLFGTDDVVIHFSLAAAETANADDYRVERVPRCGHFVADERPDLVRSTVIALAAETSSSYA